MTEQTLSNKIKFTRSCSLAKNRGNTDTDTRVVILKVDVKDFIKKLIFQARSLEEDGDLFVPLRIIKELAGEKLI